MKCPRDNAKLNQNYPNKHSCLSCKGVFYSGNTFSNDFTEKLSSVFTPTKAGTLLTCSDCGTSLIKLKYKYGRLWIDRCPNCSGLWLDSGEEKALHKILLNRSKTKSIHISKSTKDLQKIFQLRIYQLPLGKPFSKFLQVFQLKEIIKSLVFLM